MRLHPSFQFASSVPVVMDYLKSLVLHVSVFKHYLKSHVFCVCFKHHLKSLVLHVPVLSIT